VPDILSCQGGRQCRRRGAAEEALVQVVQLQQLLADGHHHGRRQQRQHLRIRKTVHLISIGKQGIIA